MKKFLWALILLAFLPEARAVDIPCTVYTYKARYHMGIINVHIGTGKVKILKSGDKFVGTLDGHSIPWNGRVFCINDTIRASLSPSAAIVGYNNGWYLKPSKREYQAGRYGAAYPSSYKNLHGRGTLDASEETMEAVKIMSQMTMLYYYFKILDFSAMKPGDSIMMPVNGGGKADKVRITYDGPSHIKIDGIIYHTWAVSFEFSYRGSMSGYTVKSQVDTSTRVPLRFSSHLPIGHVEMTLIQ